jgi:hypothetical protein
MVSYESYCGMEEGRDPKARDRRGEEVGRTTFIAWCGFVSSRRSEMEPAPLVTLMIRAVVVDLASKGAKASTVIAGPTVFVVKAESSCLAVDSPFT